MGCHPSSICRLFGCVHSYRIGSRTRNCGTCYFQTKHKPVSSFWRELYLWGSISRKIESIVCQAIPTSRNCILCGLEQCYAGSNQQQGEEKNSQQRHVLAGKFTTALSGSNDAHLNLMMSNSTYRGEWYYLSNKTYATSQAFHLADVLSEVSLKLEFRRLRAHPGSTILFFVLLPID